MKEGMRCAQAPSLEEAADRAESELSRLPDGCLRLVNPHLYKVSITQGVNTLRLKLMTQIQNRYCA